MPTGIYKRTPEHIAALLAGHKAKRASGWKPIVDPTFIGRKVSEAFKKPETRRKVMACLQKGRITRQQVSEFYVFVSSLLLPLGYVPEYEIASYFVDFALPENKIVIECDNQHYHRKTQWLAYDRRREEAIEALGWKFIRVPEPRRK